MESFVERIVESLFQGVKISGEYCSNCLAFQICSALPNMVIYVCLRYLSGTDDRY